ncbi:GAF domain-containing protein [Verrucomicrobium sp. GAS474]|uniref:sensor histidine kinase n=1 Tax=Verrucomicrobium sp. GAS474 TaxID=1882831 RepID=UPI00087A3385|nr:GAF domain-containing sensor histidine kinase [Verrucomicrobium sp. GAS474]SDT95300.1 GAF domain-containing protein [Verrucomicrobium sp. GAS474]
MIAPAPVAASASSARFTRADAISIALFVVTVGLMGYIRLYLFEYRSVSLTYALPMLLCLWHKDRRLLWAMAAAFAAMSTYKTWVILAPVDTNDWIQWAMQMANLVIIGAVLHKMIAQTAVLRRANEELVAREEEISSQNEEMHTQSEELAQQNEEMQQQGEELQTFATQLERREAMLHMLLQSLTTPEGDLAVLKRICDSALGILDGAAATAAIIEKVGDQLIVRAHAGDPIPEDPIPYAHSFAAVVMEENRVAFVADLADRPDLRLQSAGARSILAAPLHSHGRPIGAVKFFSSSPRPWTSDQFRVIEWVAAQSSLILEIVRLHEELSRANTGLETLVRVRTAKLHELVEELEHFSYTITHDMRAPLRAMQGFSEILCEAEGLTQQDRNDYLGRIITAASRMDRLITDALSYNKAVREELILEAIDPARLLREMIESYPEFHPMRLKVTIGGPLPAVRANAAGLTQCFSNLLANGAKFVIKDRFPEIRVDAGPGETEGTVRLRFADNGIGIAPEMIPKIFGMFHRGSREYEGTGVGLALVRKVVERMGGKVGVESKPGEGSLFWIELSRAEA